MKNEQRQLHRHNGIGRYNMMRQNIMITTEVDYPKSSNGTDESTFLKTGLSYSVSTLFIILSLRSLLSAVKNEKSSKDGEQLQLQSCSWIAVSLLLSIFTLPYTMVRSNVILNFEFVKIQVFHILLGKELTSIS